MRPIENMNQEALRKLEEKFPDAYAYLVKIDRIQKGTATKEEVESHEKAVKEFSKRDKVTLIDGLG